MPNTGSAGTPFHALIEDILCGTPAFLGGLNQSSGSFFELIDALVDWGHRLDRPLSEILAAIEPCIRQSVLMSLLPAQAFESGYEGSIDKAIAGHLQLLNLTLAEEQLRKLRDICLNVRRFSGMTAREARNSSYSLGGLRTQQNAEYQRIRLQQSSRCFWCGVELDSPNVVECLDHIAPKHIGDDIPDGSNWALSCSSCNMGKGDALAWAATVAAHDYVTRSQFADPRRLSLEHRWSVLARSPQCDRCLVGTAKIELRVYLRVATGLPVPSNCSTVCVDCAPYRSQVLEIEWCNGEEDR